MSPSRHGRQGRRAPTPAPVPIQADRLHLALAAIGLALGVVALGASWWCRRTERVDPGWVPVALVIAVLAVLVVAGQLATTAWAGAVLVTAAGALVGVAVPRLRRWSPDALFGAGAAVAVLFAVLPDTEGAVLIGAALLPLVIGSAAAPVWWRGSAATAATAALVAAIVVIAVGSAADRDSTLAVALAAGSVCAALVIGAGRLLLDRGQVTSGRGRPSR